MSSHQLCLHAFVSGRVQGVFFRRGTYDQCVARGLTGWVRNTADGRVEVMACGEEEALQQLKGWLSRGPAAAKVTAVDAEFLPYQEFRGFEIR